nr:YchO/YchP family invasin [Tenebrionicola larvae]
MMQYAYLPVFVFISTLCLAAEGASAQSSFIQRADNPFVNNGDMLPDLGFVPEDDTSEKAIASMVKTFGEASMTDNGLSTVEQARQFAFSQLRDVVADKVASEAQSLLSSWGRADFTLAVDLEGNFTGSSGALFTPWEDSNSHLTWTQIGVSQLNRGLVGNLGAGQRWVAGNWLLGYNTFYDTQFDDRLRRAGLGAEAWGEYLRLSANYYQPLGDWRLTGVTRQQRMARGYDVTAQAWLPFYRHINTSVSLEHYFGDNVDLFNTGSGYRDPVALKVGVSYTPVPLMTLTASHKQGEKGNTQGDLGLKVNYRFGVPLAQQLSAAEVESTASLRGSRYDRAERSGLPVMAYRQSKTLSVYLATPPWELSPAETVRLKVQVRSRHGVKHIFWQGDTRALSLTPPASPNTLNGWTIIMPAWDDSPDAENAWRLSVTVEDEKGQRVTSNWITLRLREPLQMWPQDDTRWQWLPAADE